MQEARAQVFQAEVIGGVVELRPGDQVIDCYAGKNGLLMEILCRWQGYPLMILERPIGEEL